MNRRQRRDSGFTLIELLVVIAIIAILAAILFPVFMQARAKAQQTTCQNNLKQLATAVANYKSDWQDYYPGYNEGPQPYPGPYTYHIEWFIRIEPYNSNGGENNPANVTPQGTLMKYVKNTGVGSCPGYKPASNRVRYESYANNAYLLRRSDSAVPRPTQYVMFGDQIPAGWASGLFYAKWQCQASIPDERHSGKLNVVFCDGHVRPVKQKFFYGATAGEKAHLRGPWVDAGY